MNATAAAAARYTDPAVFGRVAVLMGGSSSEREVSLDSGRNVLEALRARGVDAHAVDGIPALVQALVARKFDRVFNVLHGQRGGGEDGVVQGLMDALGVNNAKLAELVFALRADPKIHGSKISGSGLGDCVVGLGKAMRTDWGVPALAVKVDPDGARVEAGP